MKKINLFEIEEKGEYYYLIPSISGKKIITDRQELIDLAVNILYNYCMASKQEIEEVKERIKESDKEISNGNL